MNEQNFNSILKEIPPKDWAILNLCEPISFKILQVMVRPYSYIAQCQICGKSSSKIVYLKVLRVVETLESNSLDERLKNEYNSLCYWYNKFKSSSEFGVIKPLLMFPEKHLLVTEEAQGDNLFDLVEKHACFYPSYSKVKNLCLRFYKVGSWIRYFQSFPNNMQNSSKRYSVEELRNYLDIRLKVLIEEKKRFFPLQYREKVLRFIERVKPQIKEEELKANLSHGDLSLSNIIVDEKKVTVLDFGPVNQDSYLLDISRLYHQLYLMTLKPIYRPSVIKQLHKALLEGYENPEVEKLTMFKLLLVRNTLTHLVTITRFWQKKFKEKVYNFYTLQRELKLLDDLMQ